ncbi:Peptidase M16 inactive domain family [Verrucomicrobiia bacterium DG1235]|nr:Peptidase M16 inactive domain family [Verrucomicrobiae bacterium DG1235]
MYPVIRYVLVAISLATASLAKPVPWPMVPYGEEPDGLIHWGKLENGLRYAIHPNDSRDGEASLRFIIETGSERDSPGFEGTAHFVEHLAFAGTADFSELKLVDYFYENGVSLTRDLNAFTGPYHTVYKLDLSLPTHQQLSLGFRFFSGIASNMQFDSETIEREKEIMRLEHLERKAFGVEALQSFENAFCPPTQNHRHPLESIESHTPDSLKQFWKTWYQPKNIVLFISGKVSKDEVETLIQNHFSFLQNAGYELPSPPPSPKPRNPGLSLENYPPEILTLKGQFATEELDFFVPENNARLVANRIIGHYVQSIISEDTSDIKNVVSIVNGRIITEFYTFSSLSPTGMRNSIYQIDKTLHALNRHGILKKDLDTLGEKLFRFAETNETDAHLYDTPSSISDEFVTTFIERRPFSLRNGTIESLDLAIREMNEKLVNDYIKSHFKPSDIHYTLSFPKGYAFTQKQAEKTLRKIRKLYDRTPASLPKSEQTQLASSGAPAVVVGDQADSAFGRPIQRYRLSNNVHLNLSVSKKLSGHAFFVVSLGDGLAACPIPLTSSKQITQAILSGVPEFAGSDRSLIETLEASGLAHVQTGANMDCLFVSASGDTRNDLRSFLDQIHNWLLNPEITEDSLRRAKFFAYNHAKTDPSVETKSQLEKRLLGEETRFRNEITSQELAALELPNIESWLLKVFKHGFCELSIVGDIDPDLVLKQVSETLGTLPPRVSTINPEDRIKTAMYPNSGFERLTLQSDENLGFLEALWKSDVHSNYRQHQLHIINRLFSVSLFKGLRVEAPFCYSFVNEVSGHPLIPESSAISLRLCFEPSREKETLTAVLQSASKLHEFITSQNLSPTLESYRKEIAETIEEDSYFVHLISSAKGSQLYLKSLETFCEEISNSSTEDYQKLAKELLKSYKARIAVALPQN